MQHKKRCALVFGVDCNNNNKKVTTYFVFEVWHEVAFFIYVCYGYIYISY